MTGLGSNPIGLDRGQIGEPKILRLRTVGNRVLFEAVNTGFRALSENDDERVAVRDSFAGSILVASEILARDAEGSVLIDLAPFLLRDAHGISEQISRSGQGSFGFDRERSVVDATRRSPFPTTSSSSHCSRSAARNRVRWCARSPPSRRHSRSVSTSRWSICQTTATARASSIPGWAPTPSNSRTMPRPWIARSSGAGSSVTACRRASPELASSPVVKPIVYYADCGAPEPVRSALRR
ncbi:MAG: DUF5117 domain-containing protein [Thermoanaerobaculia bacterium]